tara:strand:- start:2459 stop:3217 length:759 start_codon:yes stop_codon:yes gene_type:complete
MKGYPYKKIISIIPARGGSKGVPKKNIRLLNGKPMIYYTIALSLNFPLISRTIVSTEDEEIKSISLSYGAEVVDRPSALAQDSSPTEEAIEHVLKTLEASEGYVPDLIVLLQPTAPLREDGDLYQAFSNIENKEYDAAMSITELDAHYHPYWIKEVVDDEVVSPFGNNNTRVKILETEKYYQRQQLPKQYYWKNGSIYVFTYESFCELGHRYGNRCAPIIIGKERSINVDTEEDFIRTEKYLKKKCEKKAKM